MSKSFWPAAGSEALSLAKHLCVCSSFVRRGRGAVGQQERDLEVVMAHVGQHELSLARLKDLEQQFDLSSADVTSPWAVAHKKPSRASEVVPARWRTDDAGFHLRAMRSIREVILLEARWKPLSVHADPVISREHPLHAMS